MTPYQFCALLICTSLLYVGKMKLILMNTNASEGPTNTKYYY